MTEKHENAGGKQAGRFRKGQSGNPAGKARGTRHRATQAAEMLLNGEAEALTRKAVEMAKAGDTTALRLCLERICPPLKERPVRLALPALTNASDAAAAIAAITAAVAGGKITASEAVNLSSLVTAFSNALKTGDFEARLAAIEKETRG
jgi:hypothetical protein